MGKILVLAEKPSVGRDLARVLDCRQGGPGCLEGSRYVVTWALGHLVTLAEPEAYGEKYKKWDIDTLPMLPLHMDLMVIKETSKQYANVKSLMKRGDVDELVIATDAGREGELVARWIMEMTGFRKPVKRLWISSQTDKAIKEGFANLKPGREYENLYRSAQCRAEADWLVGLNITRALTCRHNAQLSAGRVQTPTLAMIVSREEEIRRFVPRDFWTLEASAGGFDLHWRENKTGQTRIFDKSGADALVAKVQSGEARILSVEKQAKKELPPLAYDLTELQRDANRRYGYSAKKTLQLMQQLYETHKLLTYPRTDSRYITDDIVPTLKDRLKNISVGPYAAPAAAILRKGLQITKRLVDNAKVTDHHAIIPTEQYVDLSSLNTDERNIYDLVVRRFLAVLSLPFEYEQTAVKAAIGGEMFYAGGKVVKAPGWKSVYEGQDATPGEEDEEDEEGRKDQQLPDLKTGQVLRIQSVKLKNGKTKPPARYTEATLLSAMEHPGKLIGDDALREAIDSTSGLGTPATRADIIEKLFDTFYVERRGREIVPTSKGMQLVGLVPADIKSPELTAKWEQRLQLISRGRADAGAFMNDIRKYASGLVSGVVSSAATFKHDNMTREKCPDCGKYLLDVNGKKGRMLVCPDRECGYRKGVSVVSNARCPQCHKKMEMRGDGEDKVFYCSCGYREKLSDFKKRRGEQVDKHEVRRFLSTQDEGGPINTALADALAKLKK